MPQPYRSIDLIKNKFLSGDTLKILKRIPSESVDCVVTSPPYWAQRDYGVAGQIGLEPDFNDYLDKLMLIFEEVRRVLKKEGTCWVNLGDTYSSPIKGNKHGKYRHDCSNGLNKRAQFESLKTRTNVKPKSLCLVPVRFAIRMLNAGWILRNEIIWHKPNAMPHSASDRFTVDFEKIFFFVKSRRYQFEQQFEPLKCIRKLKRSLNISEHNHKTKHGDPFVSAINPKTYEASRQRMLERGRNMRSVWSVPTTGYPGEHFASFTPRIIETPIKAGCPKGGIVLDPFMGSGTTALVAKSLGRSFIGIELNHEYIKLARQRLKAR